MRNSHIPKCIFLVLALVMLCLTLTACGSVKAEELEQALLSSDFADDVIFHDSSDDCFAASFSNYDLIKARAAGGDIWATICKIYDDLSSELHEQSHKKVNVVFLLVNPAKTYDIFYATMNGKDITDNYSMYWREAAMLPHNVGEIVSYESVIEGSRAGEIVALKAKLNSIRLDFSDWCHYDLLYCDENGDYAILSEEESFLCFPENEIIFKRMTSFNAGDEIVLYYSIYSDNSFGPTSLLWVDYAE